MLEDGDRGLGELADKAGGCGDVEDVVEGEFLAVKLLEVVKESAVELGLLVGVLAVTEAAGQRELERKGLAGGALVVEVGADGAVVGAGGGEGLHRKAGAQFRGGLAVPRFHGVKDARVVGGIDDDRDGAVVLGAAADHRGAPDVDLLDGLLERHALLRNGLLKGIEIHANEIDRKDAVLGGLGLVIGVVAEEEESSVDLGDECLHAAVHHLGESGVVGDLPDGNPGGRDRLGGTARGEKLHALLVQAAGKVDESGLVGDGEECALDFHERKGVVSLLGKLLP